MEGGYMNMLFDKLVTEAMNEPFKGWNFSYIVDTGRMVESPLKWNYFDKIKPYIDKTETLLDLGTGGGEVLSMLKPLPPKTYATESYPPNVQVAREKLLPLGVNVIYVEEAAEPPYNDSLPFRDSFFDLIINRHEAYSPRELKRVLKRDGVFITQQVGCFTTANLLKDILGSKANYGNWNLQSAINELEKNEFTILDTDEYISTIRFHDIGAIVYYLKAIPWLIEDFSPEKYRNELVYIHNRIKCHGCYEILDHRFIIIAETKR
jgi:SAM-dependent methyltransferase